MINIDDNLFEQHKDLHSTLLFITLLGVSARKRVKEKNVTQNGKSDVKISSFEYDVILYIKSS